MTEQEFTERMKEHADCFAQRKVRKFSESIRIAITQLTCYTATSERKRELLLSCIADVCDNVREAWPRWIWDDELASLRFKASHIEEMDGRCPDKNGPQAKKE